MATTLDRLLQISREPGTSTADKAPERPPERSSHTGRGSSPYGKHFRTAFDFLQRYTENPPQSPEDWDRACADMVQCAQRGDNDLLLMDLLCAAYLQIERVYKATRT